MKRYTVVLRSPGRPDMEVLRTRSLEKALLRRAEWLRVVGDRRTVHIIKWSLTIEW